MRQFAVDITIPVASGTEGKDFLYRQARHLCAVALLTEQPDKGTEISRSFNFSATINPFIHMIIVFHYHSLFKDRA